MSSNKRFFPPKRFLSVDPATGEGVIVEGRPAVEDAWPGMGPDPARDPEVTGRLLDPDEPGEPEPGRVVPCYSDAEPPPPAGPQEIRDREPFQRRPGEEPGPPIVIPMSVVVTPQPDEPDPL